MLGFRNFRRGCGKRPAIAKWRTATVQAVRPVIREYEHQQNCRRVVLQVQILGATREEEEAAS